MQPVGSVLGTMYIHMYHCGLQSGSARVVMHAILSSPTASHPSPSRAAKATGTKGAFGVPRAYERNFAWKIGHFRQLCSVSCVWLVSLCHVPHPYRAVVCAFLYCVEQCPPGVY